MLVLTGLCHCWQTSGHCTNNIEFIHLYNYTVIFQWTVSIVPNVETNIRTEEAEAGVPDKEILVKINEQGNRKTISVSDKKWESNKRVFVRRAFLGRGSVGCSW